MNAARRGIFAAITLIAGCLFLPRGTAVAEQPRGSSQETGTVPDTISIVTLNTRNLSDKADTARIDHIASLVEHYDLVALEELRDTVVLRRVVASIERTSDRDFEAVVSKRVGTAAHGEYYGFVFDRDRVSAGDFEGLFDDTADSFARDPGFHSFRSGGFDFVVVAVHITWGRGVRERRAEICALPGVLTEVEQRHLSATGRPEHDVILIGDFNRPESDRYAFGPLRDARYTPALAGDVKTTVGDVSAFDNVFLRPQETAEFTGNAGVDEFDERIGLSPGQANRLYSDHRPVWAVFRISGEDDD